MIVNKGSGSKTVDLRPQNHYLGSRTPAGGETYPKCLTRKKFVLNPSPALPQGAGGDAMRLRIRVRRGLCGRRLRFQGTSTRIVDHVNTQFPHGANRAILGLEFRKRRPWKTDANDLFRL